MSDQSADTDTEAGADSVEPLICMPCRGTGQLSSGLGGTPHEVACPWCRGTGKRIPGIDAQESPAEISAPPAEPPPEA